MDPFEKFVKKFDLHPNILIVKKLFSGDSGSSFSEDVFPGKKIILTQKYANTIS